MKKTRLHAAIALLVALVYNLPLAAQNVLFFGSNQGLSNSRIRNIYEDSRHNIWLTTQSGLNRYDGVEMNVYRHSAADSTSLLHDESTCVFELEPGKVLVGTGAGVQLFDYATDRFHTIPFLNSNGDTVVTRVVSICRVHGGRIMVCYTGYGHGVLKRGTDGSFRVNVSVEFNTGHENANPVKIMDDRDGNVWILNSSRRIYCRRPDGKTVDFPDLTDVRDVCQSRTGNVYVAQLRSVHRYDPKTGNFTTVAGEEQVGGVVTCINPWINGRVFICSDGGGLRVYDEETERVTLSTISTRDINLATANANYALSDSYGNVWVGIYMKGAMMKPVNWSPFEYVGSRSITKNSIGSSSVFALAPAAATATEPQGLWVAADNDGLYRVSLDGTHSTHFSRENTPGLPQAFTVVCNPDASTMLLGTFSDGLWKKEGNRFSKVHLDINQIFDIAAVPGQKGCFWISTMGQGFYYYDMATGKVRQYRPDYQSAKGTRILRNSYVYAVYPVGKKILLIGTSDGLSIAYPGADGSFTKASTHLLEHQAVRHFTTSEKGAVVWAATNMGLARIDMKTMQLTSYTTDDGLPSNSINALYADGKKLWIGTDMGLSYMNIETGKFTSFFADDGLQDNEFARAATIKIGDNIYAAGIGGMTYFDTKFMDKWLSITPDLQVRFVDVYVNGKKAHVGDRSGSYDILTDVINDCERIDLNHDDSHFAITLKLEGLSGQNTEFEYSINGGTWVSQGAGPRMVFDNLQPGTYRIRVRAHAFGTVSRERELLVAIHPAWYASPWAKLVYVALFLLLCWIVWQYIDKRVRLRRVMRRHRQQEELNEARVQFFMNISHEIRTPMTLILAPLERLIGSDSDSRRQHQYQLIRQNAQRIMRLINQMMDVRKIEQGKFLLDYSRVELVSFLQGIFDVFASNAQSRQIAYTFEHEGIDQLQAYVDPDNMDKIVMNLLSNSFKFTPDGGTITLRLAINSEKSESSEYSEILDYSDSSDTPTFTISVTDSGVGIPDEDKPKVFERFYSAQHQNGYIGTGIGLNLTSMLVRLHQGTIAVTDNPEGHGTQFTVNIPVGDESLRKMKAPTTQETAVTTDNQETADSQEIPETPETQENMADLLPIARPTDTHRRHCLLVEDDEAIRQYVHSELSGDLVIQACTNGQEAWDYLMQHPGKVDLVISDIMMPVMDGMTLCQKIKANFTTNHIPVLLMTALGSDADRIAGITNGADAYISKPFNIDVLHTTAIQLMKSRQVLQGKFHGDRQQEEKIDRVEVESADESLMRRVMKVINENMDNSELSVEVIADKVGISRVHFYRKMKDLTGQAPRDYVKYVRLKEAARLLSEKKLDITGVSIATGFKTLSSFSTSFKGLYGMSPTEWVKRHEEGEDE